VGKARGVGMKGREEHTGFGGEICGKETIWKKWG